VRDIITARLAAGDAQDVGLIHQVVMQALIQAAAAAEAHITTPIIMAVMVAQALLFLNMQQITVSH